MNRLQLYKCLTRCQRPIQHGLTLFQAGYKLLGLMTTNSSATALPWVDKALISPGTLITFLHARNHPPTGDRQQPWRRRIWSVGSV